MENKTVEEQIVEFNSIIDAIETRCMATDGPVTPTLQAATEDELSRLWHILQDVKEEFFEPVAEANEISSSVEKAREYLISEGIDPDAVVEQGVIFVRTTIENQKLSLQCAELKKELQNTETLLKIAVDGARDQQAECAELKVENEKLRNANAILGKGYHDLQAENESLIYKIQIMKGKIALKISTYQLIIYDVCVDGYLYRMCRNGKEQLLGHERNFIKGISNINKLLKPV